MFYSEKDIRDVRTELFIFIAIDVAVLIAGFALAYFLALNIAEALGTVCVIICVALCVFIFGNFVSPCYHYYKYLLEVLSGRFRVSSGVIKSISSKPIYKDNKNHYYEVDIEVIPGKYALFLYDANLGEPPFSQGQRIKCLCCENYMLKVQDDIKDEY